MYFIRSVTKATKSEECFMLCSVDNRQRQALLEVNPDLRCTDSPSGMSCSRYIIEIKVRVKMKG